MLGARHGQVDRERQRSCNDLEPCELLLAVGADRQVALELGGFLGVEGVECERGCLLVHHGQNT